MKRTAFLFFYYKWIRYKKQRNFLTFSLTVKKVI